jgi:hypothetical protein
LEQALAKIRKSLDLQRESDDLVSKKLELWTVLLSAPIEAYAMLEDYARAFEVAETMLSPDEQREGLVALLRERAYSRNSLWRQLSETGL